MTVHCPHARLRLAASLAPLGNQQASPYTLALLKRAVVAFDAGQQVATDHKAMLMTAREIIAHGPTTERWANMASELATLRKKQTFINVDLASRPSVAAYWWDKGDMA